MNFVFFINFPGFKQLDVYQFFKCATELAAKIRKPAVTGAAEKFESADLYWIRGSMAVMASMETFSEICLQ